MATDDHLTDSDPIDAGEPPPITFPDDYTIEPPDASQTHQKQDGDQSMAAVHKEALSHAAYQQNRKNQARQRRDAGGMDFYPARTLSISEYKATHWPTLEELASLIYEGGSDVVQSFREEAAVCSSAYLTYLELLQQYDTPALQKIHKGQIKTAKDAYSAKKLLLPYITPSSVGYYGQRHAEDVKRANGTVAPGGWYHTGLTVHELDGLQSLEDVAHAFDSLRRIPVVWFLSRSASLHGLYCFVGHQQRPADWKQPGYPQHLDAWLAADTLIQEATCHKTDTSIKDIRRVRFVTHDEQVYLRPLEERRGFHIPQQDTESRVPLSRPLSDTTNTKKKRTDGEYPPLSRDTILAMLSHLHPDNVPAGYNGDYDWWLAVCMALQAYDDAYLDIALAWSAQSTHWDEQELRDKWRGFDPANVARPVTIGTVIHFAEIAGWTKPWKKKRQKGQYTPKRNLADTTSVKPDVYRQTRSASGEGEKEHTEIDLEQPPAPRPTLIQILDEAAEANVAESNTDDAMAFPWSGGFLERCATYLENNYSSPRQHNALSTLCMIAAIIQHKAQLSIGGRNMVFPQLYGIVIAPPHVYRKSSALYGIRSLLIDAELSQLLLPSDFTAEGIRDVILDQSGDEGRSPAGGISLVDDGAKKLFSRSVKYLETVRPLLLQIAQGGRLDVARVSKGGAVSANWVRFSLLTNSTPEAFFSNCDIDAFADGLMSRFICAFTDGTDSWEAPPVLSEDDNSERRKILTVLRKLSEKMNSITTPQTWIFPPLYREWVNGENRRLRELLRAGESSDWHAGNWGRSLPRAGIFAILIAATNWAEDNGDWLYVTDEVMVQAIAIADHYAQISDRVYAEFLNNKTSSGRQQTLLTVIRSECAKSAQGWITLRALKRNKQRTFKPSEIERLIEELHDRNAITLLKSGKSTRIMAGSSDLPVR